MPQGGPDFTGIWRRPQIGVSVYPVTKQLDERFGVDGGVMINEVKEIRRRRRPACERATLSRVGGKAVKTAAIS